MKIVGLTGGIASGKSTVSAWFKKQGVKVIDADQIVRELQQPHSKLLEQLAQIFGNQILNEDGSLNRDQLGKLIFHDEVLKKQLEEIIHPAVKARMKQEIAQAKQDKEALIILDIPLLYESGFDTLTDLNLVVYIPEQLQIKRLMKRDQISQDYALAKIKAQLSLEEKKHRAHIVIDNQGSREELQLQLAAVYQNLIK